MQAIKWKWSTHSPTYRWACCTLLVVTRRQGSARFGIWTSIWIYKSPTEGCSPKRWWSRHPLNCCKNIPKAIGRKEPRLYGENRWCIGFQQTVSQLCCIETYHFCQYVLPMEAAIRWNWVTFRILASTVHGSVRNLLSDKCTGSRGKVGHHFLDHVVRMGTHHSFEHMSM